MLRDVAALAVVYALTTFDHGTSAIGIWRPDRVILSADSKITRVAKTGIVSAAGCKVRITNGIAYTAAGFYGEAGGQFDLWRELDGAATQSRSVEEMRTHIVTAIAPRLAEALGSMKANHPDEFRKHFSAVFTAIALAGVEGNRPVMRSIEFLPSGGGMGLDEKRYPPGGLVHADAVGFTIMGEHDAIDQKYPDGNVLAAEARHDPATLARQLVELEIGRAPDLVGPPVAMVEVTAAGARLVAACQQ